MGEALAWRQVVYQRGPASSDRNSLALVMAQWSWSLARSFLGRMCPQSQSCRGVDGVVIGLIPSHKGESEWCTP